MSDLILPGLGLFSIPRRAPHAIEHVLTQRPLRRVLAFTRHTIDDVINDAIAAREVVGYYKLYREVERSCEVVDLERQWNPLGV